MTFYIYFPPLVQVIHQYYDPQVRIQKNAIPIVLFYIERKIGDDIVVVHVDYNM